MVLMGCKEMHSRFRAERTADIGVVFIRNAIDIDPDTGKSDKGHLCTICKYVASFSLAFHITDFSHQEKGSAEDNICFQRWCLDASNSYCEVYSFSFA